MVREHAYVFGAAGPADGCHDSLIPPYADTGAMSLFLRVVAKRHRGEYVLMFMDRAGWHRSGRLKVPPNMKLAFLPPYSPELNPQERVWDGPREKSLANRLFKSLDAVEDAAVEGLRRLEASPSVVASLTRRSWLQL
jgi:transposase